MVSDSDANAKKRIFSENPSFMGQPRGGGGCAADPSQGCLKLIEFKLI